MCVDATFPDIENQSGVYAKRPPHFKVTLLHSVFEPKKNHPAGS
jgi:hypothetical protein